MSAAPAAPPRRKKMLVVVVLIAVCSIGAGALVPRFYGSSGQPSQKPKAGPEEVFLPFGEVTVNLAEGRLSRYLRVKVVLVVDRTAEKEVQERVEQRKALLKNWLIAHLSDKSLRDVTGRLAINRIRREIHDHIAGTLYPDGGEHIHDVLFEEFVVQ